MTTIFRQVSLSPQRQQHDEPIRAVKSGPFESSFGIDTGIYIFHPSILDCIPPRQPFDIREHLIPALLAKGIQLQSCTLNGYWNPLDTFQNYMEAQNVFLASAINEMGESERKKSYRYNSVQSRQISEGIWSGKNVRIHRGAKLVPPVTIGSNSWIGRDAELGPSAVIGSSVVVDQGATIRNSIVLDDTYVGKLVHVENRLVNQDQLVNLYANEYVQISDSVMLGRTDSDYVMSGLQRPLDFCLASLVLLITLPLTLSVAILLTLTTGRAFTRVPCSSSRVSRRREHSGNTDTFDLLRFNTRKAGGRAFPFGAWLERWEGQRLCELLNVIKGDLALVGLKPVMLEEEKRIREAWRLEEENAHAGFTGEWYLHTDEHSPLEDSLIADTYYLATPRMVQYWRILIRTPVAWFRKVRRRFEE